jgi:nitroimidazol reductase NimA-like FMN-containing flavoprotein (pyridoxamine 5'-phosphate oxidase superfamily)
MTTDELHEYGVVPMDDDEIRGFLSSQSVGVLGLPSDGAPVVRPLSFWYDGDARLYFLYIVGASSRKEQTSIAADAARFLVYRAETQFNWRSVLLTGRIDEVTDAGQATVPEAMEFAGRPDVLERASQSEETKLYRFAVEEQSGLKHLGLPPAFENE